MTAAARLAPGPRTTAAPHHTPDRPLTGELHLGIERRGARSVAAEQFHTGALRVLRAHYPDARGQPLFTVVNPGGGYLGGDAYSTAVEVREGASVQLTTQAATKVYRTPQGPARADQRFALGPGARLESLPDPVIAYRGARYRQDTRADLAPDASLALAEVVTPGWAPDGQAFSFEEVSLVARVRVGGRLAVVDNLLLRPAEGGTAPLMLAGRSHVGSLLVVDPHAHDDAVVALRAHLADLFPHRLGGPLVGITRLAVPGFALRVLADSTGAAEAVVRAAVDWTRDAWHGLAPVALRKY